MRVRIYISLVATAAVWWCLAAAISQSVGAMFAAVAMTVYAGVCSWHWFVPVLPWWIYGPMIGGTFAAAVLAVSPWEALAKGMAGACLVMSMIDWDERLNG